MPNLLHIDNIGTMVRAMKAIGINPKGMTTLDEMKKACKNEMRKSDDRCGWTAKRAFSVLSESKYEEQKKKRELLELYRLTKQCLGTMEEKIISLLNTNFGDINEKFSAHEKQLERSDYYVLVAGETSAGKSSFINLLLGETLLPYSLLSTTSTICELKYGTKRKLIAHYKEQGRYPEVIPLRSDADGKSYLEQISPYAHKKNDREKGSPFERLEIFWPHELLQKGINIIDSPGIGESEIMDRIVRDYLPKAFAFIYIVNSANAGGVQRDRIEKLLGDVQEFSTKRCDQFPPECALFVVNKWDEVPAKQEDTVKEFISRKLTKCWPGLEPKSQIVYFSTKNASKAQEYELVTEEFHEVVCAMKNMIEKSVEARMIVHWRWLNYFLSRMTFHAKAFLNNASRDREEVSRRMASILKQVADIEKNQHLAMNQLEETANTRIERARSKMNDHIKSGEFRKEFTTWTNDDAPSTEHSWAFIENEIQKIIEGRFVELIREWEEREHVFEDARASLCEDFHKHFNVVESQLRGLEKSALNFEVACGYTSDNDTDLLFTTNEKIFVGITAPIWVPLTLAALVISAPILGIISVKEKIEESLKQRKYEKNKVEFLVRASEDYLRDITSKDILDQYIQHQLEEVKLCLKEMKARIPMLIEANKNLFQHLQNEDRSKEKIEKLYRPKFSQCEKLSGKVAFFGITEILPQDLEPEHLHWTQDQYSLKGSGSFAHVYEGKLSRVQSDGYRSVAIKVSMKPLDASNAGLYLSEMEALRKLKHGNIVHFYGATLLKKDCQTYIAFVMELCSENLRSFVEKHREMIPGQSPSKHNTQNVITWAMQVSAGLAYIHQNGVVHRDLKMENVLVTESNILKISDVGLAKPAKDITGTLAGTVHYMAPEVLSDEHYYSKADIYSFGLMLWEMWYGKVIDYRQRASTCSEVQDMKARFVPDFRDDGKKPRAEFIELIKECLRPNPKDRPSAAACYYHLAELLNA